MAKSRTAIRYPDRGRIRLDGGLSNKFERNVIEDNQSPECLNVIFDDGAVETRGGTAKLNATSVGSFAAQGLYTRHDQDGANTMVAWWNGTLYDFNATSFVTIPSAQSVYSAGNRVYSAEYENHLFFSDASGIPYKYGGSGDEFTRHGIYPPSDTASLSTASTGSVLTGSYRYAMTNVNTNLVESDYFEIGSFTASSENTLLSSLPVAPQSFGVDARNLYRTEAGGSTFKRLATISDNTTTTYEDGTTDGNLGVDAPTDQGVPPASQAIIYHAARLFFIDPTDWLVKYSEIGNPYVVKALSFLQVGDEAGDKPRAFAIYDNSLIVFCETNPWLIYMASTDPNDWAVVRVRANYGCRSPKGVFNFSNQVMFPALDAGNFVGFSAVAGTTTTPSATFLTGSAISSDLMSEMVEPDMLNINEGAATEITSYVFKNKAYIAVPYGTGQTTNNRIYVYDFSPGRVKRTQFSWVPWTGINAYDFTDLDGKLYCQSSIDNGFVYEMNTSSYNDDGATIDSYIWSKEFSGIGDEYTFKDFRDLLAFFELSGAYNMQVNIRTDSDRSGGDLFLFNLDGSSSLWGSMIWGSDNWSAGVDDKEERKYIAPLRGKRIQFKFSNGNIVDQKFKLLGFNFSYNRKGIR